MNQELQININLEIINQILKITKMNQELKMLKKNQEFETNFKNTKKKPGIYI